MVSYAISVLTDLDDITLCVEVGNSLTVESETQQSVEARKQRAFILVPPF